MTKDPIKVEIETDDWIKIQSAMFSELQKCGTAPSSRFLRMAFSAACEEIGISITTKGTKMKPFHLSVNIEAENKNAIKEQLLKLIAEIDSDYGKPSQGIISGFQYEIKVTTKLWNNREY